jgi:hypothetical protein
MQKQVSVILVGKTVIYIQTHWFIHLTFALYKLFFKRQLKFKKYAES